MFGLCLQPPVTVAHLLQRRASFGALKGSVRFETDSGSRADVREEERTVPACASPCIGAPPVTEPYRTVLLQPG